MIRYNLICKNGHGFEGWFQSSAAYDEQRKLRKVRCPECNSGKVDKQIMAPNVGKKGDRPQTPQQPAAAGQAAALEKLKELQTFVQSNFDNVGDKFAEEARKIHYGETEERGIYGQTTDKEAKELADEGVPFAKLPLPRKTDA